MTDRHWAFRLYVAGQTPIGDRALTNLRSLLEQHLPRPVDIEVLDLSKDPALALTWQIVAVPTVIRTSPAPEVRVIGDLSDADQVRIALQLPALPTP